MPARRRKPGLVGRRDECDQMTGLVAAAKAGRSQTLVLKGEAGIGKTALLQFLLERAVGCQVARAAGVESEMELAFAGLHQLCSPHLKGLHRLPAQQQEALSKAFGLRPGPAPDRLLVGLAVLSLLSEVAAEKPLICLIDDAQWLDHASSQTLEFVAERLAAESVAMVFAVRDGEGQRAYFVQFPELVVRGLRIRDAAALLESTVPGTLDPRIRDRIIAESHGNPLALLELPRGLTSAQLAFGMDSEGPTPLVQRLEQGFLRRVLSLPRPARQLLLTAAADPVGDVRLVFRAAGRLGIGPDAFSEVETAGLIELCDRIRFRHPLVRSAVYRSATHAERRAVHRALAEETDAEVDPDRRAWHHACAAVGPDESVAAELERSAGRAVAHGGLAAAGAFLERAAILTPDSHRRAVRSLAAAQAKLAAGAIPEASSLLSAAEVGPLEEADRARIELLQAQMSFAVNRGSEALPLLLTAARRLERLDSELARDTYLEALGASVFAGRLAAGPGARQVAAAVRDALPWSGPRRCDVLLDALSTLYSDGYEPAASPSRRAVQAFMDGDLTVEESLRSAWLAALTAASLWDDVSWDVLTRRHLTIAREAGALSALPVALTMRVVVHLFSGDLGAAAALVEETRSVVEATKSNLAPYGEIGLLALRGDPALAEPSIQRCLDDVVTRGEGVGINMALWARAVLCNGLGRYQDAYLAAQVAAAEPLELGPPKWALAELVEAGVRSGNAEAAAAAHEELSAMTGASGTEWALGVRASRGALLRDGLAAEDLYLESIERLARTTVHVELARARLLYGEWLRRAGRRVDARAQLRTAHENLTAMGVDAFAERASRELLATGETVRKRTVDTTTELTAQEAHIARLAAQGLSNPEIGAALFISARTVEWHLRKIFAKLGISTRRELRRSSTIVDSAAAV
jgi:DNA-binding CsgD family transcriptional regulator